MSSEHVLDDLAAFLSGDLGESDRVRVREHLERCDSCSGEFRSMQSLWDSLGTLPEETPDPAVRARFYDMLNRYGTRDLPGIAPPGRTGENWFTTLFPRRPVFQLGFILAAVAAGMLLGYRLKSEPAGETELAQLHNEVRGISRLLTISLLQQESASERLRGVSWSYRTGEPDAEITAALLETLRYDPNMNVRLAALDALSRNPNQSGLREDVLHSLPKQSSPLVQAAIIDLMIQFHEKRSIDVLRQMEREPNLDPSVKRKIEQGIQELTRA
jgi:HEAT repeat protein/putative zinc finger protein